MMGWTDRHCRYFHRQLTRHSLLYTEMLTTGALLHGDPDRLLHHHPAEHPLALQIGGSDPASLAACARLAQTHGFAELNLNCGCPSPRVQTGAFGACLMRTPALVADCITAMRESCTLPITVKCRIGVDDQDPESDLQIFAEAIAAAGCRTLIVHARKALLAGLSPKANREIPPLNHPRVHRLKRDFPHLQIILNGGITTLPQAQTHLPHLDGIMMGRAAYQNPWQLTQVDQNLFPAPPLQPPPAPPSNPPNNPAATPLAQPSPTTTQNQPLPTTPRQAAEAMFPYIESELTQGTRLHAITRHMLGLFRATPGARQARRHLSEQAPHPKATLKTLKTALTHLTPKSKPP